MYSPMLYLSKNSADKRIHAAQTGSVQGSAVFLFEHRLSGLSHKEVMRVSVLWPQARLCPLSLGRGTSFALACRRGRRGGPPTGTGGAGFGRRGGGLRGAASLDRTSRFALPCSRAPPAVLVASQQSPAQLPVSSGP